MVVMHAACILIISAFPPTIPDVVQLVIGSRAP